jgi:hypothetical protein
MAKVKAVFYLPLVDNDGRSLQSDIEALEIQLYLEFVGWSFIGHVKGTFQMADGSRKVDESAAYTVVFEETRVNELETVLRTFKQKTSQEAIYLEIHRNVDIRFIE